MGPTQPRTVVTDTAHPDGDAGETDGGEPFRPPTVGRERFDIGSRIPGAGLLATLAEIYREETLRPSSRPTPYHERERTDSADQWELIAPNLSTTDETALDIGCENGFFTAKLADEGLSVTGIDIDRKRIEDARRTWEGSDGVEFVDRYLDPGNVSDLPPVDVVLVLTPYKYWCSRFGSEGAEEMLRGIAARSNRIFFQPPGEANPLFRFVGERPLAADEPIVEYYTSLLTSMFDGRVGIDYLGEAGYPSDATRTDPVFLLECRDYTT